MSDARHIPVDTGNADVQMFVGTEQAVDIFSQVWRKPRGKSMVNIILVGAGGNGGTGVIGANSTAAGGAGGQSGATTIITIPLFMLPDILYLSLAGVKPTSTTNFASKISFSANAIVADVLVFANGGLHGGNAAGGTGGTVGTAAAGASASNMSLGWLFTGRSSVATVALGSQVGTAGGAAVTAANLVVSSVGAFVTGGAGGGGLPAAAAAGTNGGNIFNGGGIFPLTSQGFGSATATVPADWGKAGFQPVQKALFYYGGTGGASTHGTATGAGLVQSNGGDGAPGCGGGGQGGALTGSTAGAVGKGGPAFAIFTCW